MLMRMRWCGTAVLLAMGVAAPCFAQDAADIQMARTLGTEGLRLAQSGDCAGAVDKLARAEKLHHAPTTLERLGECQIALGHYVEGTENLRTVTRERLEPSAPPPFVAAKARAQKALDAALPHIGKLRVDVAGAPAADVTLKIDAQPVSAASLGVDRPIDPGAHVVEASAPGYKSSTAKVDVGDGASQTVTLMLERGEGTSSHVVTTTTVTHRVYWPAGVAFGLAGAAAVVTAVFGSVALADKNALISTCGGTTCPPSERGTYNDASTFASVTNVGLIVAGVAAATGIVFVLVAPKHAVVERVGLRASPFGASLVGSF
jgi:hypothetical protein